MNTTYTRSKVVRTWMLLLSVPLYMGTAALWMKEEIKYVLGEKQEEGFVLSVKDSFKKPLANKGPQHHQLMAPTE